MNRFYKGILARYVRAPEVMEEYEMASNESILIAVDESLASERAVAYVGRFVSKCTNVRICLLHVLPPIPPGLLESGGSSDLYEETRQSQKIEEDRDQWIQELQDESRPLLEKLCRILTEAGVPGHHICTCFHAPHPGETVAQGILNAPCGEGFNTIVVGREEFPWYQELFHRHVSKEIEREGRGHTIWIVE